MNLQRSGAFQPALGSRRSGAPCYRNAQGRILPIRTLQHRWVDGHIAAAASSSAAFGSSEQPAPENDYKPFPRMREGNPYKLLGLTKDASFEEVQDARNYLFETYRWHEPSRESIELAFESILKEKMWARKRFGFKPPRTGRRTDVIGDPDAVPLSKKFANLFDPSITMNNIINEGVVYAGLAVWALFSGDQSFPLAGAFAYSVYKFQSKRMAANPEGPFFGGNAIVGALLTTALNIGLACALMTVVSLPLSSLLGASVRQVGAFFVILMAGMLGVYMK